MILINFPACATANRSLMDAVSEVYEPEWGGKEEIIQNAQSAEMLWNDFAHRLAEQVLIPLNTYQVTNLKEWCTSIVISNEI